MNVEIHDDDLEAFFDVPFRVYGPRSPYVSPPEREIRRMLDPVRNPLFGPSGRGARRVLTVHRDGVPVGRLVASVHGTANRRFGWRRAQFGFFDCADDREAAAALFAEAESFAHARASERLTGNFNLTAMQPMGVVTDGHEHAPYDGMVWNPPHVPRLLESLGYAPTVPMRTFELALRDADAAALDAGTSPDAPRLRWTLPRGRALANMRERLLALLNEACDANPLYVPLSSEELAFATTEPTRRLDAGLTVVAHDESGPVALAICAADRNPTLRATGSRANWATTAHHLWNRAVRGRAVLLAHAVAPRARGHDIGATLLLRTAAALRRRGYRRLGIPWIADDNTPALNHLARLGARPLHRVHLYEKVLR